MKKYELSENEIDGLRNILDEDNGHSAHYIRTEIKHNLLPELFKSKVEVGKWYKSDYPLLVFIEKIEHSFLVGYGFDANDRWMSGSFCNRANSEDEVDYERFNFRPATDEEVKEVLVAEAKRRGFVDGATFDNQNFYNHKVTPYTIEGKPYFSGGDFCVRGTNGWVHVIFRNGEWAKIIEQPKEVTLAEIEEKFGCKVKIVA